MTECPPTCKAWQGGCKCPPLSCTDWRAWKHYAEDLGALAENLSGEVERLTEEVERLRGVPFSDRNYHALKSRLKEIEADYSAVDQAYRERYAELLAAWDEITRLKKKVWVLS